MSHQLNKNLVDNQEEIIDFIVAGESRYAWWPRKMENGQWVWMTYYTVYGLGQLHASKMPVSWRTILTRDLSFCLIEICGEVKQLIPRKFDNVIKNYVDLV